MRHAPLRLASTGGRHPVTRVRKARHPKGQHDPPLSVFASETVVRLRDGIRRDLCTFIDPASRFALACAAAPRSSRHTTIALQALCALRPAAPRFGLSDNGSEFMGAFDAAIPPRGMTHWWPSPRSPKMNAPCKRFNRTMQERFVDDHEDRLCSDLAAFNHRLAEWLIEYNTVLPHHGLGLQTPLYYLAQQQPECQMWWTYTSP